MIARRDRPAQARRNVAVEARFPLVESQAQAGLAAHRIGRGDLQHYRLRPVRGVAGIGQRNAVALAHLTRADALDGEIGDGACSTPVSQSAVRSLGLSTGWAVRAAGFSLGKREALPRHAALGMRVEFDA